MPIFNHIPELIIVLVLGLLIFGPKRLPEMGNAVGKTIKEFQRTMKNVTEPEHSTTAPAALPTSTPVVATDIPIATGYHGELTATVTPLVDHETPTPAI